jgi:hypothetical protein
VEDIALHPIHASPAHAERAFEFLLRLGFHVSERLVTGGESFQDLGGFVTTHQMLSFEMSIARANWMSGSSTTV